MRTYSQDFENRQKICLTYVVYIENTRKKRYVNFGYIQKFKLSAHKNFPWPKIPLDQNIPVSI